MLVRMTVLTRVDAGLVILSAFVVIRAKGKDGTGTGVLRMNWARACLMLLFATSWLFVLSSASTSCSSLMFCH